MEKEIVKIHLTAEQRQKLGNFMDDTTIPDGIKLELLHHARYHCPNIKREVTV